ncbi:hypothetical protein HDU97_006927 [Phlyctochytrium planicorne]|nr:hypothetical protein HDU97_006927 [Phlyctochytrium planicorne]
MKGSVIRTVMMVIAFFLFCVLTLSIVIQATASHFVVSEVVRDPSATANPDNWVGPWTLCRSGGACKALPMPCDRESFPDGVGDAFQLREEFGADEDRLCSRFKASRAVFLIQAILAFIGLIVLCYAMSAWSLRFFILALIITFFTFVFSFASIFVLVVIKWNLDNLAGLMERDTIGDNGTKKSSLVKYALGWGFYATIALLLLAFFTFMILACSTCCVRTHKKKDYRSETPEPKQQQQLSNKNEEGFISSPYPSSNNRNNAPYNTYQAPPAPQPVPGRKNMATPAPHPSAQYEVNPQDVYEDAYDEPSTVSYEPYQKEPINGDIERRGTNQQSAISSNRTITKNLPHRPNSN